MGMAPIDAPLWPEVWCGNEGTKHSKFTWLRRDTVLVNVRSKDPHHDRRQLEGRVREDRADVKVARGRTSSTRGVLDWELSTRRGKDELLIPCYFSGETSEKSCSYIPNQSRVARFHVC